MNDTNKKNNEQKIISSLVRDFIIYIDQECFNKPEEFTPFADLVVPTLRKYNQKLNVNCDYIKHVRDVLSKEKNLKSNLDIMEKSGRLNIVDCDSIEDLISQHHSDANTLFITQIEEMAVSVKSGEDAFDSNNLFIKKINLEASLDYFKGIRNKYASLGNAPSEAARVNTIIIDISSIFYENTSFFLEDLNLYNNPSYPYKIYVCKRDLDKFYQSAKVSHFADSSYSRLDREFGAITYNPDLAGRDDSATIRKFRTEKNVGVLTFDDSRASEFFNMNEPDLSGRWVCPFKIKDGDANTDYPSSPWKKDINSLFERVKELLNSNEDSFAKYAELSKVQTAASIEEDKKKKEMESAPASAKTRDEVKKAIADPIIKVNNSDFSDLVVESEATRNNDMMFAKSKDFAKTVIQPKSSEVVPPLQTASVSASTINPEVSSSDDRIIKPVSTGTTLKFVKDEKTAQPAPAAPQTKPAVDDVISPVRETVDVMAEKAAETVETVVIDLDKNVEKETVTLTENVRDAAAEKADEVQSAVSETAAEVKESVAEAEDKNEDILSAKENETEHHDEKKHRGLFGLGSLFGRKKNAKEEDKTALADKVEEVKTSVADKVAEVRENVAEVKEAVSEKAEEVKAAAADKVAEARETVAEVKEAVSEKAQEVKAAAADKVAEARETVAEVKEAVSEKAQEVKSAAADKVAEARETVAEVKEAVSEKAQEVKTAVADKIAEAKETVAEVKEAVSEKAQEVKAAAADKVAEVRETVAEVKEAVSEKAHEVKAAAADKATEVKETAADVNDAVAEKVSEVKDAVSESKPVKSVKDTIAAIVGDTAKTSSAEHSEDHNKKVKFQSSGLGFNFTKGKKPEPKKEEIVQEKHEEHKNHSFVSGGPNFMFSVKKKSDIREPANATEKTVASAIAAATAGVAAAAEQEHKTYSFKSGASNFMFSAKKKADEHHDESAKSQVSADDASSKKGDLKADEAATEELLNLSHETAKSAIDSGTAKVTDVPSKPQVSDSSNFDSKGASVSLADAIKVHSPDTAVAKTDVKVSISAKDAINSVSADGRIPADNGLNRFRVSDIASNIVNRSNSGAAAASESSENITAASSSSYKDAVSELAKKTKVENSVNVGSASAMAERSEEIKKTFEKTVELASEQIKSGIDTSAAEKEAEVSVAAEVNDLGAEKKSKEIKDLVKNLTPVNPKLTKEQYAAKGKSIVNSMLSSIDQVKSTASAGQSDAIREEDKTPAALNLKPSATGFNLSSKDLEKIQKEREAEKKAKLEREAKQREEDIALGKIKVSHVPQDFKLEQTDRGFNVNAEKAAELKERHRINSIGLVEALKAEKSRKAQEAEDYAREVNTVKAIEEFELEGENADFVYSPTAKAKDETPISEFEMTEERKKLLRNYEVSQRSEVSVKRNLESSNFYNANDKRKTNYGNAANKAGQASRKVSDVRGFDSSLFSDKPKSSTAQRTNPERSSQDYARVNQMIEQRYKDLENKKEEVSQARVDTTSTQSQTVDIVISSQDGLKAGASQSVEAVKTVASKVEETAQVTRVTEDKSEVAVTDNVAPVPFARTGNPYQTTIGLGIVNIPKLNDSVFINGSEVKLSKPIIMSQSLAIYANDKDPGTIIKIFGRDSLTASMIAKLETMMDNMVSVDGVEWPRALVKNEAGDIVGCVMRSFNTTSLQVMCNSKDYFFHDYNRVDIVKLALDYLTKVAKLHELNIYLGVEDLNALAIDASKKLSFLNIEKMQVGDYPYLPQLNAVTAPELSSELSANMASEISDRYVVAHTLFKLVFLGRSPYVTSYLQGVPVDKLTAFRFPENVFDPMVPPKDEAFYIWSYLPQYIKEAFISSLSAGYHEPERRKTVNEWITLMKKFMVEITSPAVAPMALEISPSRAASADSAYSVECKFCRSAVSKIDAAVTDGFCHHCFNQRGRLAKCSCCGKTFLVSYRDIKVAGNDSPKFCQSCKTKFMHTKSISKCHECHRSYVVTEGDELMYGSEIYSRCQNCLKTELEKKKAAEAKSEGTIISK